jgi:hypothetical protein
VISLAFEFDLLLRVHGFLTERALVATATVHFGHLQWGNKGEIWGKVGAEMHTSSIWHENRREGINREEIGY